MDLFVVATCSLIFAIAIGAGRHVEPKGPPVDLIARDLGTTPQQFEQAAKGILPRFPHGPPTEDQKRLFAASLDISVDRLDSVMEKYRPDRLRSR